MEAMRYLIPFLAIAFVPAERHRQEDAKLDLDRLQGAWILIKVEREQPIMPDNMLGNQVLIMGDEYKRFTSDEPPILVRTLRLLPDTQPKGVDLVAKNPGGQDFIFKGIYDIRDDTFKFCFAMHGNERPTEFRIGPNSTANTITTYRVLNRGK